MSPISFESLLQDLRYSLRLLRKNPGFSAIAILTLALGIGANTAIFSVVNGVLLNPLPFHHPEQLVSLFEEIPNFKNGSISYPDFVDWRRMNRSFSSIAAYRSTGYNLTGSGEPEHLHGQMISVGFFEILGVTPSLGRTFTPEEDRLGADPTVMITEGLWKRKFGSAPDILGKRLILDDVGRTIIGVVPSSFHLRIQNFQPGESLIDVYTPVGEFNEPKFYDARGSGWGLDAIGRLKPGVTLEQAREDMSRVSRDLATAYPDIDSGRKANLLSLKDEMVGNVRPALLVLLGAVAFVLLIACVNVANLLLARSTTRQHEFAVRIALGAGQTRMVRQLLTESFLLALIGGALGLLLAKVGAAAALAAMPQTMPRAEEIGLDPRVLLFTMLISLLSGMVFGLAPAWKTSHTNVGGELKESGRGVAGPRARTQALFVVGEMAMALVLLIGAGLMIRSLFKLWRLDPGFNPSNVTTFQLSGPSVFNNEPADATRAAFRQIHERLASTPGVEAVSFNRGAHPMQNDNEEYFWLAGRPKPAHTSDLPMALQYVVEPDYLQVMQIQLKRGRFFTSADNERAAPVVLIDERMAEKYFAGQDPVGQYLDFNIDPKEDKKPNSQIVGIVGHVNQWGLAEDATNPMQAQMYLPFAQVPDKEVKRGGLWAQVFVRTEPVRGPDFTVLQRRLADLIAGMTVFQPENMQETVTNSVAGQRFAMLLLAVFAGLALLLASIGIYGVLSYLVGQRVREIGIRMALGAQQLDVLRMILNDGGRMTLAGILLGLIAAGGLTRLMASLLFGIKPSDPLTFSAVAALLGLVALAACYFPARRAMKVDPLAALRHE